MQWMCCTLQPVPRERGEQTRDNRQRGLPASRRGDGEAYEVCYGGGDVLQSTGAAHIQQHGGSYEHGRCGWRGNAQCCAGAACEEQGGDALDRVSFTKPAVCNEFWREGV